MAEASFRFEGLLSPSSKRGSVFDFDREMLVEKISRYVFVKIQLSLLCSSSCTKTLCSTAKIPSTYICLDQATVFLSHAHVSGGGDKNGVCPNDTMPVATSRSFVEATSE